MPAQSKSQMRMMAMAQHVKHHPEALKEMPAGIRDQLSKMAHGMTDSQLNDFKTMAKKRKSVLVKE